MWSDENAMTNDDCSCCDAMSSLVGLFVRKWMNLHYDIVVTKN